MNNDDPEREAANEAEALRERDPEKGITVLRALADRGSVTAMLFLASAYQGDRGVPVDLKQAVSWYQKAQDRGSKDAYYYLGGLLWEQRDIAEARAVLTGGAEQGHEGCRDLLRKLDDWECESKEAELIDAALILKKTDAAKSLIALQDLANKGVIWAMLHVAQAYRKGIGTSKDASQAKIWHRRAFDLGRGAAKAYAAAALGYDYLEQNDYVRAYAAFQIGADLNNVLCLRALASLHRKGRGCSKDYARERSLLEQAAASGNVFAKRDLAFVLMSGRWGWREGINGFGLFLRNIKEALVMACKNPKDTRLKVW
ncbi:MAG TPA: hypothetical protein VMV40_01780 [Acidiferrobacter sp.]|nr:hypothetical protein [Acidiferrobacter sp.]